MRIVLRGHFLVAFLAALIAAACGGVTTDNPQLDGSAETVASCAVASLQSCEQTEGCQAISGVRYFADRQCRESAPVAVGCRPQGRDCTEAVTHASGPDGGTWEFINGCVPDGWTLPQGDTPDEVGEWDSCQATGCRELSPEICSQTPTCQPIIGLRYSSEERCREKQTQAVGCRVAGLICTEAITHAVGPNGETWEFINGCIPDGWGQGSAADEVDTWPLCEATK